MLDFLYLRLLLFSLVLIGTCHFTTQNQSRNLRAIILLAILARFSATLFTKLFPVIPYTRDYGKYRNAIEAIVAGWTGGAILPISPSSVVNSYSYLVAPVYLLVPSPIAIELLNGFFGALIVFNVYRISSKLFDNDRGIMAATLATLYPSFIHYTSILMRDSIIILLVSEIIYLLVVWIENDRFPVSCLGLLPLVGILRPENLSFLIPAIIVAALLRKGASCSPKEYIGKVSVLIAFGISLISAIYLLFPDELPSLTPESLSAKRAWLARDTAKISGNYLSYIVFENWLDVLAFTPVGALYFLLVPFPWMVRPTNTFMIIALVENLLLLYPVFLIMVFRLRYPGRLSRGEILLLVTLVIGATSYGLVEGNMGPAMRHRLQFTYLIIVLASPSLPLLTPFPVGPSHELETMSRSKSD